MKRTVDLASGILGLVLFAPVMVLVAIAIRLDSRGPIFYRQIRVGLGDRQFQILKFRSMFTTAEADSGAQWSHEADLRVTRVGRILRKYHLDELPQFINMIRGEMSLVWICLLGRFLSTSCGRRLSSTTSGTGSSGVEWVGLGGVEAWFLNLERLLTENWKNQLFYP